MKLTNGMNKTVAFNLEAIKEEASQQGKTSFVQAEFPSGKTISISQHESGDWDICGPGDDNIEFEDGDATEAVKEFMQLCLTLKR